MTAEPNLVRISFNSICFCARCCRKVRFGAGYWMSERLLPTWSGKHYRLWGGKVLCPGCYCWLGGMRYDPSIEESVVIENRGRNACLHERESVSGEAARAGSGAS